MMEWSEKRILVTGAEGFIGSHLCTKLLEHDAKITAIDIKKDLNNLEEIKDNIIFICGDVTNFDVVKKVIKNVDIVYHLAAQGGVHISRKEPWETVYTNIIGSLNILEASRISGEPEIIVYPGSDKEYGELKIGPFEENHPLTSINSPYDVTKIAVDRLFFCYNLNYKLPTVVLRFSNVYGPKQSFRNVIPEFIRQALFNNEIVIKTGTSVNKITRDFVFIEDIIDSLLLVVEKKERAIGDVFNIGTGKSTDIIELAKKIFKLLNIPVKIKFQEEYSTDIKNEVVDWNKAKDILGWSYKVDLIDGLNRTVKHYKTKLESNL